MQTKRLDETPPWVVPALVAGVAVPTFTAFWIGGRPELGALWAAVSVVFALVLVFGSRTDAIRVARGLDDDERSLALEAQAMTVTALVLVVALAGLFLAAGVRGESGLAYGALLVLAEVVHLGALAVLTRRS